MAVLVPLNYLHFIYNGFIRDKWDFIYRIALAIFIYHKDELLEMDEIGDILVFLSSTREKKEDKNWLDLIEYAEELKKVIWYFCSVLGFVRMKIITSFFNSVFNIWFSYNHYLGASSIQTCLLKKLFFKGSKPTSIVQLFPDLIPSSTQSLDSMVLAKVISLMPSNSYLEALISKCWGFQVQDLSIWLAMVVVSIKQMFLLNSDVLTKIWGQQDMKIARSC